MARSVTVTCDICGATEVVPYTYSTTYKTLEVSLNDRKINRYELCPVCMKTHGFAIDKPLTQDDRQSQGDALMEVIATIVAGELDNRGL